MLTGVSKLVTAYRVSVLITLLLVGMVVGAIYYSISSPILPASVATYEIPVITTNNNPLCPGEKVVYDQVAHFNDTPTTIRVASTVWSVDNNITVISDKAPPYVNYMHPTTVNLHGEWVIPADLPPGKYERRIVSTAEAHQSKGFAVPFEVKANCK